MTEKELRKLDRIPGLTKKDIADMQTRMTKLNILYGNKIDSTDCIEGTINRDGERITNTPKIKK